MSVSILLEITKAILHELQLFPNVTLAFDSP